LRRFEEGAKLAPSFFVGVDGSFEPVEATAEEFEEVELKEDLDWTWNCWRASSRATPLPPLFS